MIIFYNSLGCYAKYSIEQVAFLGVFIQSTPANAFRCFSTFLPCHLNKLNILAGEHSTSTRAALNLAAMELNNILSKVSAYSREYNYGK